MSFSRCDFKNGGHPIHLSRTVHFKAAAAQPSRARQAIVLVILLRSELIFLRENVIQGNNTCASVCPNLHGHFVKQDEL